MPNGNVRFALYDVILRILRINNPRTTDPLLIINPGYDYENYRNIHVPNLEIFNHERLLQTIINNPSGEAVQTITNILGGIHDPNNNGSVNSTDRNGFSKIFKDRNIELPVGHRWSCPISLDVMNDPVYLGRHAFDRDMLLKIPDRKNPLTREYFYYSDIQPADDIRQDIQDFIDSGLSLQEYEEKQRSRRSASLKK